MNKNTQIISIAAIVAIFVALYFYKEDQRKKNIIEGLEEDRLRLILDSLNNNKNLSSEVKIQIKNLIERYQTIDKDVSQELTEALQLFQLGHTENAIEDLVKIIGHLLEKHYVQKEGFIKWMKEQKKNIKRPDIHDLITYCHKVEKKLNAVEYQFFIAIKTIRNKEDHQINLQLDNYINASGIIAAIGAILKIQEIIEGENIDLNDLKEPPPPATQLIS